ncbi:MarR family winged helix-turn-helix transcriptional regulator [Pinibacter aurantiacus]|uniref:MarR family transcriptional regulator n=1 Tax=Pinibacter aurantiacus TaxID=2851599 RepID=A0A9E2SAP0_9BACT|nr:MarR family transcriptional regulator [Pinibacter aurantiacus]MBV4356975.1 MarR family transcriptional regulator [Pinibacter aurantiacus]
MNIINELGELAIGARMRRLYDVFSKDVMKIYNDHNLDFEAKYFTLFYLVSKRNGIGIMDAAEELSLTHPAIIHLAKDLEKKGLIESVKSPLDSRKRLLMLSRKGKAALPAFNEVWNKIDKLNKKLMRGQKNNLLKALEEMENLLDEKSYYKRYQNI